MKALKNEHLKKQKPHSTVLQCRETQRICHSVTVSWHYMRRWRACEYISVFVRQKAGELYTWRGSSFGAGHYLSWLSDLRPQSETSSDGVSRTGLTKPSNSALSSGWVLTKSFSHSSALESSEAEVGPLFICLPPGLSAARKMSSSVRDLSQTGSARLIPGMQERRCYFNGRAQ